MKAALKLAALGVGYVHPNPLVGAIIVKNKIVIGQGYHRVYGGPHAEIEAFKNATDDVSGATMYVTLEPCIHFGKTPPCAHAIVEKGIKRVVIGMLDPNPLVSGKGIDYLRKAGIEVICGVLEDEAKKQNEIFLKYITKKEPFVIMKSAMTLDGKIATHTSSSKWVTGESAREYVHQLRHQVTGIMVGIGTVLADDPSLTTRLQNGIGKDPIRIIVDSNLRIPETAKVITQISDARTIIAVTEHADSEKIKRLESIGVLIIRIPSKNHRVDLKALMIELGRYEIDSILLEGGSELNYSAIEVGIVDKVLVFIGNKIVGGNAAKTPIGGLGISEMTDAMLLDFDSIHKIGDDLLIEAYLRKRIENNVHRIG
ncbi:MAG: riboflavin biosynthesis protein RibD [Erysipelotrichaceae bacterium]|nr:MAG: riboflavin biosynthesis protein [Erysipelotrichaceae bacterium]TXT16202.1 MAG: riboflavin biosynthesis protein RibD [Erysipelotrichaceae bacterium]